MGRPLRVYLFGWFGYRNLGDDLLLEVMLRKLSSIPEVSSIEVAVHERGYLEPLLSRYPKARASVRSFGELVAASRRNDVLVVGPGGLFPHSSFAKVGTFAVISGIWRLMGRDVLFFLFGANARQSGPSRAAWRAIESLSSLFVPRDSDLIETVGFEEGGATYAAADAVFSLDRRSFFSDCAKGDAVAFSFANLFGKRSESYERFVSSCASVVETALRRGCGARLLSFSSGSDETLNGEIAERAGAGVAALEYEETLAEVRHLRRYRAVVGMRFHACVLSLLAGVPLVPVSYSSKTERLAKDCGMESHLSFYCNDAATYYGKVIPLDAGFVSAQLAEALSNPGGYVCDEKTAIKLKRRSEMAFESLERVLTVRGRG